MLYVSVPCPCCKKVLYNTTRKDGLFSLGTDPPARLYWRDEKCYIECFNCRCEVEFKGAGVMEIPPGQTYKTRPELEKPPSGTRKRRSDMEGT